MWRHKCLLLCIALSGKRWLVFPPAGKQASNRSSTRNTIRLRNCTAVSNAKNEEEKENARNTRLCLPQQQQFPYVNGWTTTKIFPFYYCLILLLVDLWPLDSHLPLAQDTPLIAVFFFRNNYYLLLGTLFILCKEGRKEGWVIKRLIVHWI
jgi:hypothetical protein